MSSILSGKSLYMCVCNCAEIIMDGCVDAGNTL